MIMPTADDSVLEHYYIALQVADLSPEKVQSITPCMMAWDDKIWLLDLTPCLPYWISIYQQYCANLHEIVCTLLDALFPTGGYRASCGADPWQTVLLAAMMRERALDGTIDLTNKLGRSLYRNISFTVWWQETAKLLEHWQQAGIYKKSQLNTAHRQLKQLEQTIDRLALAAPLALSEVALSALQRRSGEIVAQIWHMSFVGFSHHKDYATATTKFPWHDHIFGNPPNRGRHLDFATSQWQEIEPLLREDFALLCCTGSLSEDDRIILMNWEVILEDMSCINIPICFRYPHHLHRESPHFRTALLQAYYSFQGSLRKKFDRKEQDHHIKYDAFAPTAVVSWTITITQKLQATPQLVDIFGAQQSAYQNLFALENQLAVPLRCYALNRDIVPEDSYTASDHHDDTQEKTPGHDFDRSLLITARYRPLFYYESPMLISNHKNELPYERVSLERTMGKWWRPEPWCDSEREYYLVRDDKCRYLWVYQDLHQRWYAHGIFN